DLCFVAVSEFCNFLNQLLPLSLAGYKKHFYPMKRFKNVYCYYPNLAISFFAVIILSSSGRLSAEPPVRPPVFGEAIKIGEVTTDSAMLWARLCETDQCDSEFRLAGCPGEVRVRYRVAGSKDEMETPWKSVDPEADYTAKIELEELSPGTEYQFEIEARNDAGAESQTGKF